MSLLVNILIFFVSVGIVWYFAGILIEAVSRIAKRFCRTGFFTAFFLLGLLTSISEISVAINSSLAEVPGVSVGNLAGASFVILLFIVPVLAIAGRGLALNDAVSKQNLLLILSAIALPTALVIDGTVTKTEGLLALLAYGTVAYSLYRNRKSINACDPIVEESNDFIPPVLKDLFRIFIGALAIFGAAHFLVEQSVYFANLLSVPSSLIGLLLLSLGTNVPEIVIAIRAIMRRKTDIALGDYLGSASMNTFIFSLLALGNGTFRVEASEFIATTGLMIVGLLTFYVFVRRTCTLTRREGVVLLMFYVAFVVFQLLTILRFATD